MKKAPSKLLALLLAVVMVFSVAAPGFAAGSSTTPAGDNRVTQVSLPDQDWQMNRAFPNEQPIS